MASKTGRSDAPPPRPATDALVAEAARGLAGELPSRRWFGAKTRTIAGVEPVDYAAVPGSGGILALFRVEFAEPPAELYCIPLLGAPAGAGDAHADAIDDPAFCSALVELIVTGGVVAGRRGHFRFTSTSALPDMLPPAPRQVARIKAEQSNTSVVFGGRAMLKIYRKLEAGPNPEAEITDFLTRHTEFRAAPRLGGAIAYEAGGEEPILLATLHEFIANQGDAWSAFQARLGEYFAVAVTGPEAGGRPDPAFARALAGADAREARVLGELTGALHMALASGTQPAIQPALIEAGDVAAWREGMEAEIDRAGAALAASLDTLPADVRDLARRAIEAMPHAKSALAGLDVLTAEPVQKIRVHGDYHLGQVLRTEGALVIVDFEGEPARPLAARRAKECALRDVAGMMRSFAYAARAAMLRAAELDRRRPRRRRAADRVGPRVGGRACAPPSWRATSARRSSAGQRSCRGGATPSRAALRVFELGKLVYEIGYEVNHRPSWARHPARGAAPARGAGAARGPAAPAVAGRGRSPSWPASSSRSSSARAPRTSASSPTSSSRLRSTRSTTTRTPSSCATSSSPASTRTTSPRGWPCTCATRCSASGSAWWTRPTSTAWRPCATSCSR